MGVVVFAVKQPRYPSTEMLTAETMFKVYWIWTKRNQETTS